MRNNKENEYIKNILKESNNNKEENKDNNHEQNKSKSENKNIFTQFEKFSRNRNTNEKNLTNLKRNSYFEKKDFIVKKGDSSSLHLDSFPTNVFMINVNGVTYKIKLR